MNGELYQICRIAVAAKKAILDNFEIEYIPLPYEDKTEFRFLPENKIFSKKVHIANNVSEWFALCKKRNIQDIKILAPIIAADRNLLGFSNTTNGSLVCFFQDGNVTYFSHKWTFDFEKKAWDILYTENKIQNPPKEKPVAEDNTTAFEKILTEIKAFAIEINCDAFAKRFQIALDFLSGRFCDPDSSNQVYFSCLPEKNIRLIEAASIADVFGAMGSWNDSPAWLAHDKGLDNEYKNLSDELLKQVRLAILYAVNEW